MAGWLMVGVTIVGAQADEGRLVTLDCPRGQVVFRLESSEAADGLWRQLPLDLEWADYGGNEKISYLKKKLTDSGTPPYAGRKGDLCYYSPWGNLAYFTSGGGGSPAPGLVFLGRIVSGGEALEEPGGWRATLSRARP